MTKVIKNVSVRDENGLLQRFAAGSELPEWAVPLVTNPVVLELEEQSDASKRSTPPTTPPTTEPPANTAGTPAEPTKPSHAEVKEKAKSLGLSAKGSTEALLAAIAKHEAENPPAPAEPASETAESGEGTTRPDLENKAKELGIAFDAELSDAELELAIATAEPQE